MSQQTADTAVAPVVRRFTHALVATLLTSVGRESKHGGRRSDARRNAPTRSSEIAVGLGLFVAALVVLLWLHLHFGVPLASLE